MAKTSAAANVLELQVVGSSCKPALASEQVERERFDVATVMSSPGGSKLKNSYKKGSCL